MLALATLVAGSAAVLASVADTPALTGSSATQPAPALLLTCSDPEDSDLCIPLHRALAAAFPAHRVEHCTSQTCIPRTVSVRFKRDSRSPERLSGHLAWRLPSGQDGRGPTLELVALDATLNEALLREYARDLVRHSGLPL